MNVKDHMLRMPQLHFMGVKGMGNLKRNKNMDTSKIGLC